MSDTNVTTTKDVGLVSALEVMTAKSNFEYPSNAEGASENWQGVTNQLALHYSGSPSTTEANNILTAIQKPTCTHSLLAITVNCGTYLVNDVTNVTADPNDDLTFLVCIYIDDTTGNFEVFVFEKTINEDYDLLQAGKTLATHLKEYSLTAAGTALVEIDDRIL